MKTLQHTSILEIYFQYTEIIPHARLVVKWAAPAIACNALGPSLRLGRFQGLPMMGFAGILNRSGYP